MTALAPPDPPELSGIADCICDPMGLPEYGWELGRNVDPMSLRCQMSPERKARQAIFITEFNARRPPRRRVKPD